MTSNPSRLPMPQRRRLAPAVVLMMALVLALKLSGYGTCKDWGDSLGGDWLEKIDVASSTRCFSPSSPTWE